MDHFEKALYFYYRERFSEMSPAQRQATIRAVRRRYTSGPFRTVNQAVQEYHEEIGGKLEANASSLLACNL